MRPKAFNFPCLLGIFAIIFVLFAPSVIAAPTSEADLEELASKPGLKISGLLEPYLEHRQVGTACGPVTGAKSGAVPASNGAGTILVSAMISTMFLAIYLTSLTYALVRPTSAAAVEVTVTPVLPAGREEFEALFPCVYQEFFLFFSPFSV
ncbi:hypothetical protein B0H14DRAFT_2651616 [Mycena olivaceomarginata]|nr:hypothetical protein B0H14DRAFT_2651616 [Mycena olivaceomarginata]